MPTRFFFFFLLLGEGGGGGLVTNFSDFSLLVLNVSRCIP